MGVAVIICSHYVATFVVGMVSLGNLCKAQQKYRETKYEEGGGCVKGVWVCVCVLAEIRLKMLVARRGEKETETVCEISHKLLDRRKVCNKNHNKQVLKQPPPAPAPLIALHSWHSLKKGNVRQGGGDTEKGAWQAVNLAFLSTIFSSASLTHNFKNYATLLCHAYKQKTAAAAAPLLATMHSYTRSTPLPLSHPSPCTFGALL